MADRRLFRGRLRAAAPSLGALALLVTLAPLLALIVTTPGRAAPAAPQGLYSYDETGGDDVVVMTGNYVDLMSGPSLDVADNGDMYLAIEFEDPVTGSEIRVYRSQDSGHSWSLWGTIGDPDPQVNALDPSLHIGMGTANRVYVAYAHHSGSTYTIHVAYAQLGAVSPSWTDRAVMQSASLTYYRPWIHSDEAANASYCLFLVAESQDANGRDIAFSRSTDFGGTWSAPYNIGISVTVDRDYEYPVVQYGSGGVVHCAWHMWPHDAGGGDKGVTYRRALNYASSSAEWQTSVTITNTWNGVDEFRPTLAASPTGGKVLLAYEVYDPAGDDEPGIRLSSDDGATWPAGDAVTLELASWVHACPKATGDFAVLSETNFDNGGVQSSTNGAPLTFTSHLSLMDRSYFDGYPSVPNGQPAADLTHGNRLAIAWTHGAPGATGDTVFFDAEWRRDPGYPNFEPGFPLALTYTAHTSPAICELDGDPESEIVFGDGAGYINAYNHDGTIVPGWPVDVGVFDLDQTVAVGDLDGDGFCEVVAGNNTGTVWVLEHDGSVRPGWPFTTGTGAPVWVSIGSLTADGVRQVVSCAGTKLHLLNPDGGVCAGFPKTMSTNLRAPAAIGDVDNNGANEIVTLQQIGLNVFRANGTNQWWRFPSGKTFNRPPTLADLDLDGDLEIAAPSDQGDVYVFNYNGTDYPGWPVTPNPGVTLSAVALAHIAGSSEPELIWLEQGGLAPKVHVYSQGGTECTGYPRATEPLYALDPQPIVDRLANATQDVIVGSDAHEGYAWTHSGISLPEWPVALAGDVELSAASGDIDQDGRVEVVFCTILAQLVVLDLGGTIWRDPWNKTMWWPMYQYNHERQGCLACGTDVVLGAPGGPPRGGRVRFAAPRPNPGAETVLSFELPERAAVRLEVCDVMGRRVRQVLKRELEPGAHQARWDGTGDDGARLPAGVYYAVLRVAGASGSEDSVRKLTLLR